MLSWPVLSRSLMSRDCRSNRISASITVFQLQKVSLKTLSPWTLMMTSHRATSLLASVLLHFLAKKKRDTCPSNYPEQKGRRTAEATGTSRPRILFSHWASSPSGSDDCPLNLYLPQCVFDDVQRLVDVGDRVLRREAVMHRVAVIM
jgi:hypothetical protein